MAGTRTRYDRPCRRSFAIATLALGVKIYTENAQLVASSVIRALISNLLLRGCTRITPAEFSLDRRNSRVFRKVSTANTVEAQAQITPRKQNREFSLFKRSTEAGYTIGILSFPVRVNGAKGMLTLRQNGLLQLKLDLTNMLPRPCPPFPLPPAPSTAVMGIDQGEER